MALTVGHCLMIRALGNWFCIVGSKFLSFRAKEFWLWGARMGGIPLLLEGS